MKTEEIVQPSGYEAFVLNSPTREMLMKRFPPKHSDVIGHHITHRFGVRRDQSQPYGQIFKFDVVGYVDDGKVEALVVKPGFGQNVRQDGKIYHITWSLDRSAGAKPVHSNDVIAKGFTTIDPPIPFTARFEHI